MENRRRRSSYARRGWHQKQVVIRPYTLRVSPMASPPPPPSRRAASRACLGFQASRTYARNTFFCCSGKRQSSARVTILLLPTSTPAPQPLATEVNGAVPSPVEHVPSAYQLFGAIFSSSSRSSRVSSASKATPYLKSLTHQKHKHTKNARFVTTGETAVTSTGKNTRKIQQKPHNILPEKTQ